MKKRTFGDYLTLGQIARANGLARASVLHYEMLGLLIPATRSGSGYRLYGEAEVQRLHVIRRYRDAGLSLATICELLGQGIHAHQRENAAPAALLESRLLALYEEMERIRDQQKALATLLAIPEFRKAASCQSKAEWTALLQRAGFDDEDMRKWHMRFETDSPDEHDAFLRSLGLSEPEVATIRLWSRNNGPASQ